MYLYFIPINMLFIKTLYGINCYTYTLNVFILNDGKLFFYSWNYALTPNLKMYLSKLKNSRRKLWNTEVKKWIDIRWTVTMQCRVYFAHCATGHASWVMLESLRTWVPEALSEYSMLFARVWKSPECFIKKR